MGAVRIRRARAEEAGALSALMLRSKAYWGYDAAFLEAARVALMLTPETVGCEAVYCAEVDEGVAGVVHLVPEGDDEALLDDLFVEPVYMGRGVGAALWRFAVAWAGEQGARALVFDADPHARVFYERMGAVVVGEVASSVLDGRTLPRMRYVFPGREA